MNTEIFKNICNTLDLRIPMELRKSKDLQYQFINYIKNNKIDIKNQYAINFYNLLTNNKEYLQIYKIEYLGEQQTYDLEVSKEHTYYANGIKVHNTCNLPNSATEEDISELYLEGWRQNCKGLTVYRDGCRDGIMIKANENKDCKCNCQTTLTHSAPKRPKSLPCDVKRFRNGGDKWISCVGLFNGQPYEIFTGLADKLNLPDDVNKCSIIKNKFDKDVYNEETGKNELQKVSRYDLVYSDKNGDIQFIEDIGSVFRSEFYNVSKMTSALLRHGMPIEFVISTIKSLDFKNDTINSWKSGVIRTLKSYIKDGEVQGEVCPECGAKIIRENGCKHCSMCSWSACG